MVVSVPNKNICLSGDETNKILLAVGAADIFTALAAVPPDKSQRYNASLFLMANKSSPNVSSDQYVAYSVTELVVLGVFQVPAFHTPVPHPKPKVDLSVPTVI